MAVRFRCWTLSLLLAAAAGLAVMLIVTVGAEPAAVHLANAAGAHPVGRILTPGLVAELARYSGIAAFLAYVGIAIDVA
jgi:hypothetical protein